MDSRNFVATVFERTLGDATLTFERAEETGQMTDRETGSTWDKATGKAVSGQLQGKQLQQLPSHTSFWFAWTDFYPETELYEPESGG